MLVLIVALALLLVLGGGGLVYYTTVVQPSQMHAQATVTAQTMQTAQAAQATSTALSYVHATATTQAVATAQVVATATALNNIYIQATGGTPALNDALAQNSTSNWTVYANGGRSCAFRGGALHASVSQAPVAPCLALNSDFGNFAYQVQMTITSGNAQSVGGIIFRTQDFSGSLYWFAIATDGSYSLVLLKGNGSASGNVKILVEGSSPVVKTGLNSANVLTVVVRGNNFYMYINQQYVASATDSSFSAGKIGVLAGNEGNAATDVAFSNAKVWTL